MRALFSWFVECGRMGDLEGLFVSTQAEVNAAIGQTVNFGEVLGKHSEIEVQLAAKQFEVKSTDQDFIDKLLNIVSSGEHTISGFNPFDYYEAPDLEAPDMEDEE